MSVRRSHALVLVLGLGVALALPAQFAAARNPLPRHSASHAGYAAARPPRVLRGEGSQPLYSDGPGSSFGFHPGPAVGPYPGPALVSRLRRADAIRETMAIDQLTRGHGYGSPFHASFYGPAAGPDTGFGRIY